VQIEPDLRGDILVNNLFQEPVAPLDKLTAQKGKVGEGTQGATGAVDRVTFEILQALEERPTLVVWLFDQSGSLHRQRAEIRERFDNIYEELGIVEQSGGKAFKKSTKDIPLLTSIIGFGQDVKLYTEDPVSQLDEIKSIVDSIPVDTSGVEKVFTAVELAADRYMTLRKSRGGNGPQRNVLLIVVTDERGDDIDRLEPSIEICRRWGMPVYVIGVPAPFGREHTLVKYVDPDPKYDQSPQWAQVDQGPETIMPERVQVGFSANFQDEPVIDSGFGPYGLTRLCYETGGIYFTVHPNRNVNRAVRRQEIDPFAADLQYFFDPAVMARYRPDYVAPADYQQKVKQSPLRTALVTAAMQVAPTLERPQTRFVRRDEAALVGDLTRAQQDAAKLEPSLARLAAVLEPGMAARETETTPRWKAGFDLAYGRVLAQKVRTETYNAMLAKLKRGVLFKDPKNNTWVITPADEISVGSKWEREAAIAKQLLQDVVKEHPSTPWALLASEELKSPIGWQWKEEFTDLSPPPRANPGNNNNPPAPARDDQKRMLDKAPKRPVPKL
ncbi:MAG: vWA domain-containing protein, partial [Planctomycetaceae bacterium]